MTTENNDTVEYLDPYESTLLATKFRWVAPEQTYYERLFVTCMHCYFLKKELSTTHLTTQSSGIWKGEVENVQVKLTEDQAIEWLRQEKEFGRKSNSCPTVARNHSLFSLD